MSQELITLHEAAELIGKNLRTIQRYIKTGKLTRFDKDGKSFVDKQEVEGKIGIVPPKKEDVKPSSPPKSAAPGSVDYQTKWVQEIQNHAQTREELGVWKGRAEAYQAFAARLLGNGQVPDIENIASNPKPMVNKSVKTYTYIIYGLIGIFFIIITIFVLIVLKVI